MVMKTNTNQHITEKIMTEWCYIVTLQWPNDNGGFTASTIVGYDQIDTSYTRYQVTARILEVAKKGLGLEGISNVAVVHFSLDKN